MHVDGVDQTAIHAAHEHHAHELHGIIGRHAQAVFEFYGHAAFLECGRNVFAAAMYDDWLHADNFQQHDIGHDLRHKLGVFHSRSAIFDEYGFACGVFDPGQRLDEQVDFGGIVGAASSGFREFHKTPWNPRNVRDVGGLSLETEGVNIWGRACAPNRRHACRDERGRAQ